MSLAPDVIALGQTQRSFLIGTERELCKLYDYINELLKKGEIVEVTVTRDASKTMEQ